MAEEEEVDYYEVLGVDRDATGDVIKRAYRAAALRWHPDKNAGSAESHRLFKLIAEAYSVLSDPQQRMLYDQYGRAGVDGSAGGGGDGGVGWGQRSAHPTPWSHGGAFPSPHADFDFADRIFRMFFAGHDPFHTMRHAGGEDGGFSPFGAGIMGMGMGLPARSMFMDPFAGMDAGMGHMGGSSFFSGGTVSSMHGGGGTFTSTSTSTTTTIEDGHRVTRTTRTTRHADGRVETSTSERREALPLGDGGWQAPRLMQATAAATPTSPGYDAGYAAPSLAATAAASRRAVPVSWGVAPGAAPATTPAHPHAPASPPPPASHAGYPNTTAGGISPSYFSAPSPTSSTGTASGLGRVAMGSGMRMHTFHPAGMGGR